MEQFRGMTDGNTAEMAGLLHSLWQEFGDTVWQRPRLLRNLLADLFPENNLFINCLHISALSGLPAQLLEQMHANEGVNSVQIRKFEADLHADYGLAWQYARWLVQVWEEVFCIIYNYKTSRPQLQVATAAEVKRLCDMLPYYLHLKRYREYYQTAEALCRLNNAAGYYARGICYLQGFGVEKNDTEAFKSFQLGAENGLGQAQFAVAVCYELGRGCTASYSKAYSMYERAAAQGNAEAAEQLDELGRLFAAGLV